jgi:hypothetical protein
VWGLASAPLVQLMMSSQETTSCSFVNKCEFQELENFSDLSVLTEEFDPGSD